MDIWPLGSWTSGRLLCGQLVASVGRRLVRQAGYTWANWAGALGWSGFGNLVGGIGLVTSLRLLQTPHRVAEERDGQS